MPANQKIKKIEPDNTQIGDIFESIQNLGRNSLDEDIPVAEPVVTRKENPVSEKRIVTKAKSAPVSKVSSPAVKKADKPGYVSLVIPNSLKTEWKIYSSEHRMTLTECMKLAMKLLKEMEQKEAITIEDGFITYQINL